LLECGAQACGGFFHDWLDLPGSHDIGFPVAEISVDGSCVLTKPAGTGGGVTVQTVKEQLLYEIGDPGNYLSPDVTVSFLTLRVEQAGPDRVRIAGATAARRRPLTRSAPPTSRLQGPRDAHGFW